MKQIEAVLKITERCNINCTYCYMFNLGNEDYKGRPAYMTEETVAAVGEFLARGAREVQAETVVIILHGGEPLMMKKARFWSMCETLEKAIGSYAKVRFVMQTNAMLVDRDWVDLFIRFKIDIGVSIDGPAEYHDSVRVDHKGNGTLSETVRGLRLLQAAARTDVISPPGAIVVVNARQSARRVYEYLTKELGIAKVNLLLPIHTHDMPPDPDVGSYGQYLADMAELWFSEERPDVDIRMFSQFVRFLAEGGDAEEKPEHSALLTISSAGDLGPDDELKVVGLFENQATIWDTSLKEFLNRDSIAYLSRASRSLPDSCSECAWQNYCRGGARFGLLSSRFSSAKGFNNRSTMCEALRRFHTTVVESVLLRGLSEQQLDSALDFDSNPAEPCSRLERPHNRKVIPIGAEN